MGLDMGPDKGPDRKPVTGPAMGPAWVGRRAGVAGAEGPAEPGSGVRPARLGSALFDAELPFAFSAFLLARVVRRFSTAPCISPLAHRPDTPLATVLIE